MWPPARRSPSRSTTTTAAAYPFRGDVVRVLGTSARVRFTDGETHDVASNQLLRIIGSYEP